MSEKKDALDIIPSRIKYYLLDWKDRNMDKFLKTYEEKRLRDLSFEQLHELFSIATTEDGAELSRLGV